jgi:hypothetical protein
MTETQRSWGLRLLLLAVLAGLGALIAARTEWVEVDVPRAPRGEAASNRFYATQQLLRRVGSTVATPDNLAQLPPPGATLVLSSWHWDLFPERDRLLRAWVEGGGHLVIFSDALAHSALKGWLPIRQLEPPRKKKDPDDDDDDRDEGDEEPDDDDEKGPEPLSTQERNLLAGLKRVPCHAAVEPESVAQHYPDGTRRYELCGVVGSAWKLVAATPVRWALEGRNGPLLLRAGKGRGEVTVIQPWALLDNDRVLRADNGAAVVAALKAGPGVPVWFVTAEARPSLLAWLWQQAAVAVLLGAAAIALGLWRGARRFGPLAARLRTGRRSMGEQIAGTAQYLQRQGPEALLAAQVRALEAVARLHIRHYDTLDRGQRAAAIARATGQSADALASALDKSLARRRTDLPAVLERLETARRLLSQQRPSASRPSAS